MILQALAKRYEDAKGEKQGWKTREADFALDIDYDGSILDIIPLEEETEIPGKKNKNGELTYKKVKTRRKFSLPATQTRTVGILPYFLSDKAGYILGTEPKKFEAAKELHNEVLKEAEGAVATAIKSYFDKDIILPANFEIPETKNDCVFMVNGRFAHENEEIIAAWDAYYDAQSSDNEIIRDLISGEEDVLWRKQESIALRGVTMGKQALVSVNSESFSSYGQASSATETVKKPAAQLGKKASLAYASALNELLNSEKHHKFISGDTLVYWAEGKNGGETEAETFYYFNDPKEGDDVKIHSIMQTLSSGKPLDLENCDLDSPFYLLCMSPNAGRISVRYFHRDSFGNVIKNNALHYSQMEIYSASKQEKFPYIPPWIILSEITVTKKASDAPPLLGGQLLNAIISGTRYPMTLYNAILTRIRAGEDVNKTKAAIIKAVLMRNFEEGEITTMALNPQSENIPYTLGRLFATLQMLQKSAVNTDSIRERFFATACANPSSVFPTILKLSMHHSNKLDNPIFFEKLKTELLGKLDSENPLPKALNLVEQGQFILGYYHQMQVFYTKKEKTEDEEDV